MGTLPRFDGLDDIFRKFQEQQGIMLKIASAESAFANADGRHRVVVPGHRQHRAGGTGVDAVVP